MADRRLQVFHAVATHLSFTKAAEVLFMTQPAVTFQVKQLEEQWNTRLFDRKQGRIALTAAGRMAFDYAERILSLSGELSSRLKELDAQSSGPLHIGASMTVGEYVLPRLIGEFKARYPAVVPSLLVGNSEAVQERVAERTLDLGFIESDSHLPTLASEVLCADELRVVSAPGHVFARAVAITPQELTTHPYIGREVGSGTREVIDHYLQKTGVSDDAMKVVAELGSPEAIKGLVATGFGFAIMSRVIVDKELKLGELVQIPLDPPLMRHFSVVFPKERVHLKLVREFLTFAKAKLAN